MSRRPGCKCMVLSGGAVSNEICPLHQKHFHLSKHCFEGLDPTELVGKPLRAGLRSWIIAGVQVNSDNDEVILTVGEENT